MRIINEHCSVSTSPNEVTRDLYSGLDNNKRNLVGPVTYFQSSFVAIFRLYIKAHFSHEQFVVSPFTLRKLFFHFSDTQSNASCTCRTARCGQIASKCNIPKDSNYPLSKGMVHFIKIFFYSDRIEEPKLQKEHSQADTSHAVHYP